MTWPEEFAPGAIRDVEDAVDWLADNGGPAIARRMALATVSAARRVVERPLLRRVRPELLPAPYRFWRIPDFPYLIAYNADRRPPVMLRVLHMSRDLPPLLTGIAEDDV